jgi:hypothetical protein
MKHEQDTYQNTAITCTSEEDGTKEAATEKDRWSEVF